MKGASKSMVFCKFFNFNWKDDLSKIGTMLHGNNQYMWKNTSLSWMWGQLYLNEQLEIASGPLLKTKQLGNLTWKHPICTESKLKGNEGIKFFCL